MSVQHVELTMMSATCGNPSVRFALAAGFSPKRSERILALHPTLVEVMDSVLADDDRAPLSRTDEEDGDTWVIA